MSDDELEASLKALLPGLRALEEDRIGDYGFEGSDVVGYEAGPADPSRVAEARALIAAACGTLPRPELSKELAKVAAVTVPSRRDMDAQAWAAVLAEELQDWPGHTVRAALERWRRREKFLPTLAEIIEECHQVGRKRRAMQKLEVVK